MLEYGRNTGAIIESSPRAAPTNSTGRLRIWPLEQLCGARDWFNPAIDSGCKHAHESVCAQSVRISDRRPDHQRQDIFFFNEEFDRFRTTLTNSATVPTQGFKNGVFNYTQPADENPDSPYFGKTITVPVDLTATGANNRQVFVVPLDPTMQKVFGLFPNPTVENGDGLQLHLIFSQCLAAEQ